MSSLSDRLVNRRLLRLDYDPPNILPNRKDEMKDADRRIVQRVAACLELHHPGHFFKVRVDHAQRLLQMNLPPLLSEPHWYTIPLTVVYCDPGLRCVVRAAGEILERYRMPRSRWSTDDYRAAVRAQPPHANRRKSYRVPV